MPLLGADILARFARPRHIPSQDTLREEAFAQVYTSEVQRIHGYFRYRLQDNMLAEDLTAEVFLRLWEQFDRVRAPDALTAWLFTTARNLVTDHYRRKPPPLSLTRLPITIHPTQDKLAEHAEVIDQWALIAQGLAILSDRERDVIELRFVAGLRNPEIARIIRVSEGNVAKIIHRALTKLRTHMQTQRGDNI